MESRIRQPAENKLPAIGLDYNAPLGKRVGTSETSGERAEGGLG